MSGASRIVRIPKCQECWDWQERQTDTKCHIFLGIQAQAHFAFEWWWEFQEWWECQECWEFKECYDRYQVSYLFGTSTLILIEWLWEYQEWWEYQKCRECQDRHQVLFSFRTTNLSWFERWWEFHLWSKFLHGSKPLRAARFYWLHYIVAPRKSSYLKSVS